MILRMTASRQQLHLLQNAGLLSWHAVRHFYMLHWTRSIIDH